MLHKLYRSKSLVALSLMLVVAGCSSGSTAASTPAGSTGNAQGASKSLVVDSDFAFTAKDSDPARGGVDFTATPLFHAMYDTLLTFENDDYATPKPSLATKYVVSPDATTFTFTIRSDVKFSDGNSLTSADVVFSLNRLQNVKDTPSYLMAGVSSVTAPNANTVVIKTSSPNPALPYVLTNPAMGITEAAVLKAHGGTDAKDASTTDKATQWLAGGHSVGTGPYVMKSFSAAAQVTLTANPTYWGPNKAKVGTVVYRSVDAATQVLDIQKATDEVALNVATNQASTMKNTLNVELFANPAVYFLFVSDDAKTSPVTANPHIQDAIRYGLDYNGLVNVAGPGTIRAPGIVPQGFLGALAPSDAIQRDLAKAKAAVKESGLTNPTVTLAYSSAGASFTQTLATKVQSSLAEVGITVELNPESGIVSTQNYRGAKDQVGLFGWYPDYPDPNDYLAFIPGGTVGLRAGWPAATSPTLAKLGASAGSETNSTQRGKLFQQLQNELNNQGPIYPLLQPGESIVTSKNVSVVHYSPVWYINIAGIGVG